MIETIPLPDPLIAMLPAVCFILGAVWGSFLNVCIYRLPCGKSIVLPGSHCTTCGSAIRWYDNIPVVSYFVLRGHCRECGAHFSMRYAAIELLTAALFVGALVGSAMEKDNALRGDSASALVQQARDARVSALGVLREISEQTGNFGAKNAQFADSFSLFLRAVARRLASIASDATSSAALIAHVDHLSSKLRSLGVQYRLYNRSPELLLEAFADMFGETA
jgi:hypothetical protein